MAVSTITPQKDMIPVAMTAPTTLLGMPVSFPDGMLSTALIFPPVPRRRFRIRPSVFASPLSPVALFLEAVTNAIADKSDGDANQARVIGVAATVTGGSFYGTNPGDFKSRFDKNWDYLAQDGMGNDLAGWDAAWVDRGKNKFYQQIAATGQAYPTGVQIVCVAANNKQPPRDYQLTVTTNQQSGGMAVGDTKPVHDLIHVSANGSPIRENLNADVILHYDGHPDGYAPAKESRKPVTVANEGDTQSPDFSPADLGMPYWLEGTYWFDVQIGKQQHMTNPVDTADRDAAEVFRISAVPPAAPVKTIDKGTSADSMVNHTHIESGTGRGGYEMTFTDALTPNGVPYAVSGMKVTDMTDHKDISAMFDISWNKQANTVTAAYKHSSYGMLPLDHVWAFDLDVTVSKPDFSKIEDQAKVDWNHEPSQHTERHEFPTWRPAPDKSWIIRNPATGQWEAVIDPDHTNATGADNHKFLDGDEVASVVNGTVAAHLIQAPRQLPLKDDWAKAAYLFKGPTDVSKIRVYEADASSDRKSSVSNIVNTGKDVTSQFDVTMSGTSVVASAKPDYLKSLRGLDKPKQLTLLVPGVVDFAHGKGAGQVRKDMGKAEGDELVFCQNPNGSDLTNAGSETVNEQQINTNQPRICGYIPPVHKDVVSEASQGGDQDSVDGKIVFPGQRVEYRLMTEPKLPGDLAYQVTRVAVTDTYSPYLKVDKQTLEVTDLVTGKFIPKSQYASKWSDESHSVQLIFSDAYVAANWRKGQNPRIIVRFEGTVADDAPKDTKVDNRWGLTLNNSLTPSNLVYNIPPDLKPGKQVTQQQASINIDGKTALLGDRLYYRITLDATKLTNPAYKVQRLGMVDAYDHEYLQLDEQNIQVLDTGTGQDVTKKLNIQVKDGVAYAFFKTVDTPVPATGETLKGDPQPTDLQEYSSRKLDPLKDPSIDQTVLKHAYQVVLPVTVIKVTDGHIVKNAATQITNDRKDVTNVVSNPLKPINPSKDVVVQVGGESMNKHQVYLNHQFLYQVDSSVLPPDRAYPVVTDWSISDSYPVDYDKPTGQWAVYATRDLLDASGKVVASKGMRIAGSGFNPKTVGGEMFTYKDEGGTFVIKATKRYLDLVSANNKAEQAWRGYVQMTRIKVGEHITNRFTETLNGVPRPSNPVETDTPDQTPSAQIIKYDVKSGVNDGDRNTPEQALHDAVDGTEIGFHIINTGKVSWEGALADLGDQTIAGSGVVEDIHFTGEWEGKDKILLKPGQEAEARGTLRGVKNGDHHTNRAHITVKPIVECPVEDDDPWDDIPGVQRPGPCFETPVVSNEDDWNGIRDPDLATTGVAVASILLMALGLGVVAASLLLAYRKANAHREETAEYAQKIFAQSLRKAGDDHTVTEHEVTERQSVDE